MKIREIITLVEQLNEVEIGGGVDSDYLDHVRSQHDYSNDQLDLFKEIPSLEPNLPPTMKIVGKIDGYRVVYKQDGNRDTADYILFDKNHPIAWIAVCDPDRIHSLKYAVEHGTGKQVKSIYLDPAYRGKNLGLKLYHWVLSNVCDYLVADVLQTHEGVRLWKKLQNSSKFDVQVWDTNRYQSRRRWAGKDFNQVYQRDGDLIPWVTLKGKADDLLYGKQDQ